MNTYLAIYFVPASGVAEWMKLSPEARKPAEEAMEHAWQGWAALHATAIKETAGAGATKRISKGSIQDMTNDVMLYSIVEARSHEAAAALFTEHPHLDIPGAYIDVMPITPLPAMGA